MQPTSLDLPRQSLDLAFRSLWKHRPQALARIALGVPVLAVEPTPNAVVASERTFDGVATVVTDTGACTLHLEFETRARPAELPRRMAHAGWVLHGPHDGLPVRGVAVLLDPHPSLPRQYAMTDGNAVLGTYQYGVVALSALDVDALLDAPEDQAGLWALVPLARGATTDHVARAAQRLRALGSLDAPELAVVSLLLGARKFGYDELVRIFHREFLMLGDGWAGIEREGLLKGLAQGRQEGRQEGRLEGRLEGRVEAARAALRTVCAARFGGALDALVDGVPDDALNDAIAGVAAAADVDAARRALTERSGTGGS